MKFLNKKGWHTGSLRNIENVSRMESRTEKTTLSSRNWKSFVNRSSKNVKNPNFVSFKNKLVLSRNKRDWIFCMILDWLLGKEALMDLRSFNRLIVPSSTRVRLRCRAPRC